MAKLKRAFFLLFLLQWLLFSANSVGLAQEAGSGWSQPIDITQGATSNWHAFGTAACDQYQNLHIFWADNANDGSSAVFYINDVSGYWSQPVDVVLSSPAIYFLASAISNQDDSFHLTWVNNNGRALVYYARAPIANASDIRAWSTPLALDENAYNSAIGVDPSGGIHIIYAASDADELSFDVLHIHSEDSGKTWSNPAVIYSKTFAQPSYIRTEMAIDEAGRIHVGLTLRSIKYGAYYEVGYLRSPDGGNTWDEYRVIDNTSDTFQGVEWIAPYAFGKDEIHLTWHDPRRLHQVSFNGGTTWSTPNLIQSLGAAFGGPNMLVKDSGGILYAVTAWSDGVFVSKWLGTQWGETEQIDNRAIDPHGQQITVCQGNRLNVVYYDRTADTTVWYSSREVSAPHISRKPLPSPSITQTEIPQATATNQPGLSANSILPTTTPQPLPAGISLKPGSIPSPSRPLVMGVVPVIILRFVVALLFVRKAVRA